jgi:hypothetical protein
MIDGACKLPGDLMRTTRWPRLWSAMTALVVVCLLTACDEDASPLAPSSGQQLRIVNAGPVSVHQLSALFPGDQVVFGDVHPGSTSAYRAVPSGVYRYAAWRFERDGALVVQPVIDWVGESPMEGQAFTYTISVRTFEDGVARIVLTNVTRDQ